EIDESEAAVVREIFQRYAAGDTLTMIATDLTARQVARAPYPGAPRTVGMDTLWRPALISSLLNCETYMGVHRRGRKRRVPTPAGSRYKTVMVPLPADQQIATAVPSIISVELFHTVAGLRTVNAKRRRKRAVPDHLLDGRLWCGTCGSLMGRDTSINR